jgi:hypothetical protein
MPKHYRVTKWQKIATVKKLPSSITLNVCDFRASISVDIVMGEDLVLKLSGQFRRLPSISQTLLFISGHYAAWEWDWEGMGTDCSGMGRTGIVKNHSRSPLVSSQTTIGQRLGLGLEGLVHISIGFSLWTIAI